MDKRVFTMAMLTILSAFILVLVIVYATNTDRINDMFGWGKEKVNVAGDAATEELTDVPIYGDQIGDSLSGFLTDDDFFDETEKIPSVVVIKKTQSGSGAATKEDTASADLSSAEGEEDEEPSGSGMAVVGQLINPNPEAATDSSGYLTSLPEAPAGGYGQYIPADQTVTRTPVGDMPRGDG